LVTVGGLGVAVATDLVPAPGGLLSSAPLATPTPDICAGQIDCHPIVPKKFATLEEATALASFVPRLPSRIPEGYQQYSVFQCRIDDTGNQAEDKLAVHNDFITVVYRDRAGHTLMVSQGFPALPNFGVYLTSEDSGHFFGNHGTVNLSDGAMAYWIQDMPFGFIGFNPPVYGLMLSWEVGRYGTGWELSTDRTKVSFGSPMSYTLLADGLSLDQLVDMAESVSFD
jgi:hypothetical protein